MKKLKINIVFIFLLSLSSLLFAQTNKKIAITIDDLPISFNQNLKLEERLQLFRDILSVLEEFNVQATGFVVGELAGDDEKILLDEFVKAGHIIANHTNSHLNLHEVSAETFIQNIKDCEPLLNNYWNQKPNPSQSKVCQLKMTDGVSFEYPALTLKDKVTITRVIEANIPLYNEKANTKYFRYPYLNYGDNIYKKDSVLSFLKESGYTFAPVTITSNDWKFSLKFLRAYKLEDESEMAEIGEKYIKYVMREVSKSVSYSEYKLYRNINQIFLCHTNLLNAYYLREILQNLKDDGWEFISLNEALKDEIYKWNDENVGAEGLPWLFRVKKPRSFVSN